MDEFYTAWWFIHNHPMNVGYHGLNYGLYDLDIHVTKVSPFTNNIEDNEAENTAVRVWLEFGHYEDISLSNPSLYEDVSKHDRWRRNHDIRLDCGGATFEEAIIKLAKLIEVHYGKLQIDEPFLEDLELNT
jgi:hypothetical protein